MIEIETPVVPAVEPADEQAGRRVVDDDAAFASWYRNEHPRLLAAMTIVTNDSAHRRRTSPPRPSPARSRAWNRVSTMESPTGWTYRVALNVVRRRARRAALEQRALRRMPPPAEGLPPERAIELWDAVSALPPRARTADRAPLRRGPHRSRSRGSDAREGRHRVRDAHERPPRPRRLARRAAPISRKRKPAMDELESRLEHQLSGLGRVPLAEPVPVEDLRRRARRRARGPHAHERGRDRDRGRADRRRHRR